jgi:hypothetical protein
MQRRGGIVMTQRLAVRAGEARESAHLHAHEILPLDTLFGLAEECRFLIAASRRVLRPLFLLGPTVSGQVPITKIMTRRHSMGLPPFGTEHSGRRASLAGQFAGAVGGLAWLALAACSSASSPAAGGSTSATGGSPTGAAGTGSGGTGGMSSVGRAGASMAGSGVGGVATAGGSTSSAGTGASGSGGGGLGGSPSSAGDGAGGATADAGAGTGGSAAAGAGATDLFNGTDLTGFNVYKATTFANNAPGTLVTGADALKIFKPENGMIHVYADEPNGTLEYHYLLQTVASYGKYNLSWDYKWGTKKFQIDATGRGTDLTAFPRDAGLLWQIHGDRTQVWPSSIEFQNKWGSTGDIYALYAQCQSLGAPNDKTTFADTSAGGVPVTVTGGLTQHARSADFEMPGVGPNAASGEGSDWNSCLLQVNAGVATYTVNGHVVNKTLSVSNSAGMPVTEGYIAWQAEQAEVYYRNLRIQVLQ